MTHYDYRMVSRIVWSATYALGTLVMELWRADHRHARGDEEDASKHLANAIDVHRAMQSMRDRYDRAGED